MNLSKLLFGIFVLIGGVLPAAADQTKYTTSLLGSSEVPPVSTPATGTVLVTVNSDLLTMRVEAGFSDLLGSVTAAHIHCCVGPGSTIGVATQLPSFVDFPIGVTAGSYDHIFDMSLASSYNPDFITTAGGTVSSAFSTLLSGLDAEMAYFNVHTDLFPGGEIRGQLALVPEPESYALLLAGLGVLTIFARRAKHKAA
ncbi:CHRD domain-containing protein [Nitrosomonas sp. Nm166]|uniref:CHRD domain-containing protein n=1 Tax=Nitrosomonas sp. Nm166 TaxID=1881054 RepID=UPI0008EA24A6|nr:CHRD domain-containing protein [Nitrosomonas sp. Nm166]SFD99036.1 PEP-CTERM protein-sorting domain-containing protein [Nitrosomonas sp. Nm166]